MSDNPDQSRYEITDGGDLVGFVDYTRDGDEVVLTHTEVHVEGKGFGGTLIRHAVLDLRGQGATVVPECPFVKSYLDKNPDLTGAA